MKIKRIKKCYKEGCPNTDFHTSGRGYLCRKHELERVKASYYKNREKRLAHQKNRSTYGTLSSCKMKIIALRGWDKRTDKLTLCDYSADELLNKISNPCSYCGCNGIIWLDRINNSRGHSKDNTVTCCKICNLMKNKMSTSEFISRCEKIFLFSKVVKK